MMTKNEVVMMIRFVVVVVFCIAVARQRCCDAAEAFSWFINEYADWMTKQQQRSKLIPGRLEHAKCRLYWENGGAAFCAILA